jgi:hypothetical protein
MTTDGTAIAAEGNAMMKRRISKRLLGSTLLAASILALLPVGVAADHVDQTIDCGSAGNFLVVGHQTAAGFDVPIGETNLFLLGDTESVLVIKHVLVNGVVRFSNPGFQVNSAPVVTCTFTGPRTGSLYTVTGILT